MKILIVIGALVAAISTQSFAADTDAEEASVAAAVEQMRQAMISGAKSELSKVGHTDLAYIHSAGREENKEQFEDWIVAKKSDFTDIALTEQKITVTGDNAVVRHVFDGVIDDNGKSRTVYLRILLVFKKTDGEWKLLARQAAKADRPQQ